MTIFKDFQKRFKSREDKVEWFVTSILGAMEDEKATRAIKIYHDTDTIEVNVTINGEELDAGKFIPWIVERFMSESEHAARNIIQGKFDDPISDITADFRQTLEDAEECLRAAVLKRAEELGVADIIDEERYR